MKEKAIHRIILSDESLLKYNKHILLDEIQVEGIELLNSKHIVLVGLGGLGCPIAQYLATSGIGTLSIVDNDIIEATNLQRQILYLQEDIGLPKVDVVEKKLKIINPDLNVKKHNTQFSNQSGHIIKNADLIVGAVGIPKFIKSDWIKKDAIVIDAGYHPEKCGDIDLDGIEDIASAYTPVPGGVGPMTINTLILQTLQSAEKQ